MVAIYQATKCWGKYPSQATDNGVNTHAVVLVYTKTVRWDSTERWF